MKLEHLVVATDLSEISARALRLAGSLAKMLGARLTVLHVLDVRGLTAGFTEIDAYVDVGQVLESLDADAQRAVPAFVQRVGVPEGVPVRTEIVHGVPVDEIVASAERLQADLLVLGTHGRSGFTRLFFGSVAEKVVRLAHRPVLTIGPESPADAERDGPNPPSGPAQLEASE